MNCFPTVYGKQMKKIRKEKQLASDKCIEVEFFYMVPYCINKYGTGSVPYGTVSVVCTVPVPYRTE